MKASTRTILVATCAGGLEAILAGEIREIGWTVVSEETGAVRFTAEGLQTVNEAVAGANLRLRTASRVLMPLVQGPVQSFDELYRLARRVPWVSHIPITHSFSITAVTRSRKLRDHRFAALRVKDAIVDAQRRATQNRSNIDRQKPDVPVVVFISEESAEVSLDTSGAPLHERGYRREAVEAPLRETLAAGLLLLAGFRADRPLLDPFCGSGTIVIEAALLSKGIAPGSFRDDFAFLRWPGANPSAFLRLQESLRASHMQEPPIPIRGQDIDSTAIRIAERNAGRAGIREDIELDVADFFSGPPDPPGNAPGIIVTNPPYGERMEVGDAGRLYKQLGDTLKQHYGGWTAWILSANSQAMKQLGLRVSARLPVFNGGLESRLYRVDLYPPSRST